LKKNAHAATSLYHARWITWSDVATGVSGIASADDRGGVSVANLSARRRAGLAELGFARNPACGRMK
jgi:hypothetical protein